jgi:hypothetical protein
MLLDITKINHEYHLYTIMLLFEREYNYNIFKIINIMFA